MFKFLIRKEAAGGKEIGTKRKIKEVEAEIYLTYNGDVNLRVDGTTVAWVTTDGKVMTQNDSGLPEGMENVG